MRKNNSFFKVENDEMDANLNTVFKLVHITSFNVSLQALMLLNQVSATREDVQNRYFSALYRRMLELTSKSTAKETFFLNLLYNSLIKDESIVRLKVCNRLHTSYTDQIESNFHYI